MSVWKSGSQCFPLGITLRAALKCAKKEVEMKKILLSVAIALTACNLTIGLGYASVCQSSKGARACGSSCAALADGSCGCQGECTAEERAWVAAGKGGDEELLEE
jgi:hypothetical protein